jgi:hypothetical protein
MTFVLATAKDSFDIILQIGAGTGLLYLVRWFWWRVNAWCEIVAMASSFTISVVWLLLAKCDIHFSTYAELLMTIAFTTVCWLITAYVAPGTDTAALVAFYRKVRPPGRGWERIRQFSGVSEDKARATSENLPIALVGWVAGCTTIWSSLFTVGNFLYGRWVYGVVLGLTFVASSSVLVWVVGRIWSKPSFVDTDEAPTFVGTAFPVVEKLNS